MKTKYLLPILLMIFLSKVSFAGNGLPVNEIMKCELNSEGAKPTDESYYIATHISSINTGFKSPERYYMKNRLNVLKKPLCA